MGIRINTVLGWGFKYCRYHQDPRFNSEIFSESSKEDFLPEMIKANESKKKGIDAKFRKNEFTDWIEGKSWHKGKKIESLTKYDFMQYSYFNTEEDEKGKVKIGSIVFTDPVMKNWKRHDDTIDYYTALRGRKDSVISIVDGANQPCQIYPYASYVHRKTGKVLNNINRYGMTELYFECDSSDRKKFKWDIIGGKNGTKTLIEWQRDIVPEPTYNIRLFCEAAKVFKDPMTVYRLKPMVITYWC
jgi:hypothetical protein